MADRPASNMNTLRLISFAMCAGMLLFAALTIFLTVEGSSPGAKSQGTSSSVGMILLAATGAIGISAAVAWQAIRMALEGSAREAWRKPGEVEEKERNLWSRYSSLVITRHALTESFGFLGIVSLLIGGQWWGLAAPAIAFGLILNGLPSQAKYHQFLSRATAER